MSETKAGPPDFSIATYFIADQRVAVDVNQWKAWVDNRLLADMKATPFRLLATLAMRAGELVEYSEMCELIWGQHNYYTRLSARVALAHTRKQLGPELGDVKHGALRTVWGSGCYAVRSLADPPLSTA